MPLSAGAHGRSGDRRNSATVRKQSLEDINLFRLSKLASESQRRKTVDFSVNLNDQGDYVSPYALSLPRLPEVRDWGKEKRGKTFVNDNNSNNAKNSRETVQRPRSEVGYRSHKRPITAPKQRQLERRSSSRSTVTKQQNFFERRKSEAQQESVNDESRQLKTDDRNKNKIEDTHKGDGRRDEAYDHMDSLHNNSADHKPCTSEPAQNNSHTNKKINEPVNGEGNKSETKNVKAHSESYQNKPPIPPNGKSKGKSKWTSVQKAVKARSNKKKVKKGITKKTVHSTQNGKNESKNGTGVFVEQPVDQETNIKINAVDEDKNISNENTATSQSSRSEKDKQVAINVTDCPSDKDKGIFKNWTQLEILVFIFACLFIFCALLGATLVLILYNV